MNIFRFILWSMKVGKCLIILSEMDDVELRQSDRSYVKSLEKLQKFRRNRRLMPRFDRDEMEFLDDNFRKEYGSYYDILKQDCAVEFVCSKKK